MKYTIRKEKKEDCIGISHVITVAWNETYKGILSDFFLEEIKTLFVRLSMPYRNKIVI